MEHRETDPTDKFHRLGVQPAMAAALASDYRPVRVLSRGGMGMIMLAQELVTKRIVAIKVLSSETKDLLPLAQQFMREAVITARLQHPNIVPVYRLGFLDGQRSHPHLFYTMKYIDGSSYASARPRMTLEERIAALAGVAAALAYAHGCKLWHRDLKPDNVMLGPHDDVYVVDWGLVSITPGEVYRLALPQVAVFDVSQPLPEIVDELLEDTPEAVTALGTRGPNKILGTPLYMSPEQAIDAPQIMGPPSDVWALGVLLFEALCDRHPYVADPAASNSEILTGTQTATIPPVLAVAPGTPEHIARLCDAMLARASDARPPASEVLAVLKKSIRSRAREVLGEPRWPPIANALPVKPLMDTPALPWPRPGISPAEPTLLLNGTPRPELPLPPLASGNGHLKTRPGDTLARASLETNLDLGTRSVSGDDSAGKGVTVVSPTGYRIEGLTAEDALFLLRELGR